MTPAATHQAEQAYNAYRFYKRAFLVGIVFTEAVNMCGCFAHSALNHCDSFPSETECFSHFSKIYTPLAVITYSVGLSILRMHLLNNRAA